MFVKKILAASALVLSLVSSMVLPASAATPTVDSSNGLKVSPVRTDVSVDPGKSTTVPITVQNVTQGTANLQVLINDFVSGDENGTPNILLNGKSAPAHGLKQYVAPIANITLASNEQREVKAVITIPANARPGGYFGVVRFAPANQANDKNVTLGASVGSLILVRVSGQAKEQLNLLNMDVQKNGKSSSFLTSSKGLSVVTRFQNTGDVQEEPFGKVQLKNRGGSLLGAYEINNTDPRGTVLPGGIRKFSVNLDKVGSFGKYTVQGNFGYGSNGQLLSASKTFYVIPPVLIGVAVIIILALIAAAFALKNRVSRKRVVRR